MARCREARRMARGKKSGVRRQREKNRRTWAKKDRRSTYRDLERDG